VTPRGRGDEGQAAVELALVLPLLATLGLLLVQVGLVVRDQVLVTHAAREGAREAAVQADGSAIAAAVRSSSALEGERIAVETTGRGRPGSRVTVVVRYRSPTDLPLVGRLLGDVALVGQATMRVER